MFWLITDCIDGEDEHEWVNPVETTVGYCQMVCSKCGESRVFDFSQRERILRKQMEMRKNMFVCLGG